MIRIKLLLHTEAGIIKSYTTKWFDCECNHSVLDKEKNIHLVLKNYSRINIETFAKKKEVEIIYDEYG